VGVWKVAWIEGIGWEDEKDNSCWKVDGIRKLGERLEYKLLQNQKTLKQKQPNIKI
jgi:hypothetical protein